MITNFPFLLISILIMIRRKLILWFGIARVFQIQELLIDQVKDLLAKCKPIIYYLFETRVDKVRAPKFYKKFKRRWDYSVILLLGIFGRIIVLWKQCIRKVATLALSCYFVHHVIFALRPIELILSVVYHSHDISI